MAWHFPPIFTKWSFDLDEYVLTLSWIFMDIYLWLMNTTLFFFGQGVQWVQFFFPDASSCRASVWQDFTKLIMDRLDSDSCASYALPSLHHVVSRLHLSSQPKLSWSSTASICLFKASESKALAKRAPHPSALNGIIRVIKVSFVIFMIRIRLHMIVKMHKLHNLRLEPSTASHSPPTISAARYPSMDRPRAGRASVSRASNVCLTLATVWMTSRFGTWKVWKDKPTLPFKDCS